MKRTIIVASKVNWCKTGVATLAISTMLLLPSEIIAQDVNFALPRSESVLACMNVVTLPFNPDLPQGLIDVPNGQMDYWGNEIPKFEGSFFNACRDALLAEPDNPELQLRYGISKITTFDDVQSREGLFWIERAASSGLGDAIYYNALMLDFGKGTDFDQETAARLYAIVAERGDPRAQYRLALLKADYEDGSEAQVRDLLMRAAESNYSPSQFALGLSYLPESSDTARYWLEKASNNGNVFARAVIGTMLLKNEWDWRNYAEAGSDTDRKILRIQDAQRAGKLLFEAAEAGFPAANVLLQNLSEENLLGLDWKSAPDQWVAPCARREHFEEVAIGDNPCIEFARDPFGQEVVYELRKEVQLQLKSIGLYAGAIDGNVGAETIAALERLCDCSDESSNAEKMRVGRAEAAALQIEAEASPIVSECLRRSADPLGSIGTGDSDASGDAAPLNFALVARSCQLAYEQYNSNVSVRHGLAWALDNLGRDSTDLYRQNAKLGYSLSEFRLADMLFRREGDRAEAVLMLRRASDSGLPAASHRLGLLFDKGEGTVQDTVRAADLVYYAVRTGYGELLQDVHNLDPRTIARLQELLAMDGLYDGAVDGIASEATGEALLRAMGASDGRSP